MNKHMSTIIEQIENTVKSVEFLVFTGLGIGFTIVFYFLFDLTLTLSIVITLVITIFGYMTYSDIQQRKLIKLTEGEDGMMMKKKKEKQQQKESKEGKCVSCTSPISPDDEVCTNCGYKIHKYSV